MHKCDTLGKATKLSVVDHHFDSTVVRARVSAAGAKGGKKARRLGARAARFTTKIRAKSNASGDIIAFDLTGGQAFDGPSFRNPARYRTRYSAPRCHLRQRLRQQSQPGHRKSVRHRSRHPSQRPTKRTSRPSSHAPSTRPAPASSRASDGSSASSGSRSDAKRPNETSDQSSASPQALA
jgi:hypothetical protein